MFQYDSFESRGRVLEVQAPERIRCLSYLPAAQQPQWDYHSELSSVRAELRDLPPLVDPMDTLALRRLLSRVEAGSAFLLHVGECAETFSMANVKHIAQRVALYCRMADHLASRTGRDVILLTRMAGQHAKPRSQPYEKLPDGGEVLSYRGDAVNGSAPTVAGRQPNPQLLLRSYQRSRETLGYLRGSRYSGHPIFVSHEGLLRDYEEPLTRGGDELHCTSGNLVWVGERTRRLWNWHVQWASLIANPVGVKIGPAATHYDVLDLVHALNPRCELGRLSLILRIGTAEVADRLELLTQTVTDSGAPVLWQCDPMHGNTRKVGERKLRLLPDIRAEISTFVRTLRRAGCHPGGLHLEVTPEEVGECHEDIHLAARHESSPPCDPRLNPSQAMEIVEHFAEEIENARTGGTRHRDSEYAERR